jgi:hypothetical protein
MLQASSLANWQLNSTRLAASVFRLTDTYMFSWQVVQMQLCSMHMMSATKAAARSYCELRVSYLVEVSTNDCTQNGGWLHDKYEVPVNQGLRLEGVAAVDVEKEVGHSTTNYGEVGKSNSVLC